MKFIKSIFAILLISLIVFSCKSEKKDTEAITEEEAAVEEVAKTSEEGVTEMSTDSIEAVAEEEVVENKKITVVYPKDTDLANEVKKAIKSLVNDNPTIENLFYEAYGFAIFPVITKAGLGIGGAGGKGLVFQDKTVIGRASLAQATLGLQAGGQQYQEVVFFENKEALDKFKAGKVKFSGQASAVALKAGASVDIDYQDGVAIFTKIKGGIMAEASVGGQNFKYKDGI